MFSGKKAESDTLLKQANEMLEKLKTANPASSKVKSLENKYSRTGKMLATLFLDSFELLAGSLCAGKNNSTVLVRASQHRTVNRASRYAKKDVSKLWDHIISKPTAGTYTIDISARQCSCYCLLQ